MSDQTPEPRDKRETSLKTFIDDYQKMLSVVGVLIVVGLFWKNTSPAGDTPYGAYLAFFAAIVILVDIIVRTEMTNPSWTLIAFVYAFGGATFYGVYYTVKGYPSHTISLVCNGLAFLCFAGAAHFLQKLVFFLKTGAYNSALEYKDLVNSVESYTPEEKSRLIGERNTGLTKFYRDVDIVRRILAVSIFALSFVLFANIEPFFQALLLPEVPLDAVPLPN